MNISLIEITQFLDYCKNQRQLDRKSIKAYKIDLIQFYKFLITKDEYSGLKNIKKKIFTTI